MFGVPVATPVTIPDDVPTVANDVLLLVHVPPDGVLFSVVVKPTHTLGVPVIVVGVVLTVIVFIVAQPVDSV